jgi:signal transduction histidine kinase
MLRRLSGGLTLRAALSLGFGVTVGLWVVIGYQLADRIADVERDATVLGARYMRAQETLASVRAQVLLGSVFVRDALLDQTPDTYDTYSRELEETYAVIDLELREYAPVIDSATEREQIEQLRQEIDEFSRTAREVLAAGGQLRMREVRTLLNTLIVPRREAVIRISEELQAVNHVAFLQHQAALAQIHQAAERHTWLRLGIALALSLAIATLATLYAARLERRLRTQTRSLQQLSSKIVSVQEAERRHIARELHDEVGQALTAMKVDLALAEQAVQPAPHAAALFARVQAVADSALNSVRGLSHALHPGVLDDLGLEAAIDCYLQTFEQRHGVKVVFDTPSVSERLSQDVETSVYRIVQEALTNVAKHAHARTCTVRLRHAGDHVRLTVEDDGVGFHAGGSAHRGLGLVSIRERAAELGGRCQVATAPGRGTRLVVDLPFRPPADAGDDGATASPAATPEALSG